MNIKNMVVAITLASSVSHVTAVAAQDKTVTFNAQDFFNQKNIGSRVFLYTLFNAVNLDQEQLNAHYASNVFENYNYETFVGQFLNLPLYLKTFAYANYQRTQYPLINAAFQAGSLEFIRQRRTVDVRTLRIRPSHRL